MVNSMASDRDIDRLRGAMAWSRLAMTEFRRKRTELQKIVYGAHWNEAAVSKRQPLNMLELTLRIWSRNLVARAPKARVEARGKKDRPLAKSFEMVMDQVIAEMGLGRTLEALVVDGLLSPCAVAKVGITESSLGEASGYLHDAGLPFVDMVDFDDLILDMSANSWESMGYVGNKYVIPLSAARESRLFAGKDLKASNPTFYDEYGNENVADMAKAGTGWSDQRFPDEMVMLWDVWRPRERCLLTFACDDTGHAGNLIREVEDWEGPEDGPYHQLKFGKGRGMLGLPPLSNLRDLSDSMNETVRKIMRQQARAKQLGLVQSGGEKDAAAIRDASDGEMLIVERPEAAREMKFGGVDQQSVAWMLATRDQFSYMAGNLDAQGGLGEVADTLGQDEMIRSSASQTISDMQASAVEFATRIFRALATFVWYDPVREYMIEKPLGQSGMTIPVNVSPKDREEADFLEMTFSIGAGSMQEESNATRLKTLNMAFETATQAFPAIQAQGLTIDVHGYFQRVASLTNNEDVASLLIPAGTPPVPGGGQEPQPGGDGAPGGAPPGQMVRNPPMANKTRREYIRKSTSTGGTPTARSNVLQQRLAGGDVTPQQDAMMGRR